MKLVDSKRVFDGGTDMGLGASFFRIDAAASSDVVTQSGFNYNRTKFQLSLVGAEGLTGTISWVSSNPSRATVDANGLVTSTGNGSVNISATIGTSITTKMLTASLTQVPIGLSVSSSSRVLIAPAATVTYTALGVNYERIDPDIYNDQYQLAVTSMPGTKAWSSSNTGIATVDADGLVTGVSTGSAVITVTNGTATKQIGLSFTRTPLGTPTITGYAAGTLRKAVEDFFTARLGGAPNPTTAKPVFTTQNHAGGVYVRNSSCWMAGFPALTCCSPYNTTGNNTRAGTLITKRHIVFANHYPINVGSTVRFVTMDNVVVDRTMTGRQLVYGDLMLGVLNSDVPDTIAVAKVLPADWDHYLPSQGGTPVIRLDQEEKTLVGSMYPGVPTTYTAFSNSVAYANYSEDLIGGDSGNPAFLPVGNDLAILCTWLGGVGGSGPFIPGLVAEINAAIATLDTSLGYSTGYTCTPVDLTGYTNFEE